MTLSELKNIYNKLENVIESNDLNKFNTLYKEISEDRKKPKVKERLTSEEKAIKRAYSRAINEAYNEIYTKVNKDLHVVVKKGHETVKTNLNANIKLPDKKEREQIINQKIGGKTLVQRFKGYAKKLTSDIKKIKEKFTKKRLGIEYRKIKRTIRTERHRVFERSKMIAREKAKRKGKKFNEIWICSFKNSRDSHIAMHNQIADSEGYFTSGKGNKTKYPGGFGIAGEDINCKCKVITERID